MMDATYDLAQKAATDGQVHDALSKLDATIDQLDKAVGNLQQRALPVLTPDKPSVEPSSMQGPVEVRQPNSPIAERIDMLTTRIRTHLYRIEHTTDRMQV